MTEQRVCAVGEVPEGDAIEVRLPASPPVFVIVLRHRGELHAYENLCPHAGRPLNWAPGRFLFTPAGKLVCAVHGATFEPDSGEAVGGPCVGRSLRRLGLRVEGEDVYVSPS